MQDVTVANGERGVVLRNVEDFGIVFGVVLDEKVSKGGDMVEAVQEVRAEVGVGLVSSYSVAQCA